MERTRTTSDSQAARLAKCVDDEERKWVRDPPAQHEDARSEDAVALPCLWLTGSERRRHGRRAPTGCTTGSQMQKDAERAKATADMEVCNYLLRLNESEMRRQVDYMNNLTEFYAVQTSYFEENIATLNHLTTSMRDAMALTARVRLRNPGAVWAALVVLTDLRRRAKDLADGGTPPDQERISGGATAN